MEILWKFFSILSAAYSVDKLPPSITIIILGDPPGDMLPEGVINESQSDIKPIFNVKEQSTIYLQTHGVHQRGQTLSSSCTRQIVMVGYLFDQDEILRELSKCSRVRVTHAHACAID
jgi:hypothetical protein